MRYATASALTFFALTMCCGCGDDEEKDPALAVSLQTIVASIGVGGAPTPLAVTLTNAGDGAYSYTVTSDAAWVECTPNTGSVTSLPAPLTTNFTTAALALGVHTATLTVDAGVAGTATIDVTVTVAAARFADSAQTLEGLSQAAMDWGDYDGDGDLDLVLSGWKGTTPTIQTLLYENVAGTLTLDTTLLQHRHGSVSWADYDNDADMDLVITGLLGGTGWDTTLYENSAGVLTDSGISLAGSCADSLAWGDYNNDGDVDLTYAGDFSSDNPDSIVYDNSDGTFSEAASTVAALSFGSLAWGDYDNDGFLDLIVTGRDWRSAVPCKSFLYRNDGGVLTETSTVIPQVGRSSVAWGDCDNDGDLDLAIAGLQGDVDICSVYRNDAGAFTEQATLFGISWCTLAWGDYDNDGDLDLAACGYGLGTSVTRIYQNQDGAFVDIGEPLIEGTLVSWADVDGDMDLDLTVVGYDAAGDQASVVYENLASVPNNAPTAPSGLTAAVTGTGPYQVALSWNDATDTETPSDGLSYAVRIGTTVGGCDIASTMSVYPSGTRFVARRGPIQPGASENTWTVTLPAGTYYWAVQAVDTSFAGSPFSSTDMVVVP